MNGNYLFDTNIVLDLLHDDSSKDYIQANFDKYNLYISVITNIELLSFPKITVIQAQKISNFLKSFQILPLNNEIEIITILIRRDKLLKIPDAIIVASAVVCGATLFTNDNRILKLKWPGLDVRSVLELNTTITTNNNDDKNSNDNDNDNGNGNHNNNDNDNENKDNDN
jgi:predicted nucleic acid-binding protein